MKTIQSIIVAITLASAVAHGWIIEKPIDYPKQLQDSDFAGLVEVTGITENGVKKVIYDDGVAFRELRMELKVLSAFKGGDTILVCSIYREPTEDELIADGVQKDKALRILLDLGVSESLHLFPARVQLGDQLLAYLRSEGEIFLPVSGDLESSRSLLRLKPSSLVSTLDQESKKQNKSEMATPRKPSD